MVIIVTLMRKILPRNPMEAVQELGETSIMIIADAAEFIRHQFICIYAFVPDQYIFHHMLKMVKFLQLPDKRSQLRLPSATKAP